MRRIACLALALALCVFAQPSRDAYRAAYRTWREADPSLERDASKGGAAIAERTGLAAALAAKYGGARTAFLHQLAEGDEQTSSWLENAAAAEFPLAAPNLDQHLASEAAAVSRNIDNFTNDPDTGIQRLREALEHERAALAALNDALAERRKAEDAAREEAAAVEQARRKALADDRDLLAELKQMAGQMDGETAAWAQYYRNLADGVQGAATPAADTTPAALPPPESSIRPVALVRYVGAWTFPVSNGVYHGAQPEFIDLLVSEESGHAKGALFGRFKLPSGSKDDPVLRFNFSGDFKTTPSQTFSLETSDGAKGTIELIPGPAFNLLEVNIQTDAKPGKIHQANVVLIKK